MAGDGCPLKERGGRRACCDRENDVGFAGGSVDVAVLLSAVAGGWLVVVGETEGSRSVVCGTFVGVAAVAGAGAEDDAEVGDVVGE